MEIFQGLINGFSIAVTVNNLLYAFLGCLLGTAVGVLPGLGPAATISLLLPIVYKMGSPATAIIFMAGIYYGAMYGGSTTSILLNLPGEAASVVTCIDGYKMALKGRAGAALGIAAIGSFIAGTVGVIGLTFVAPPLAEFALRFGPPEYFSLTLVGLLLAVFLSGSSLIKGLITLVIGLLLASVGLDPVTGKVRFSFGIIGLQSGFDFVTLAMGVFGLGEIFYNLEQTLKSEVVTKKIGNTFPTLKDIAESKWAIIRGSIIGFFTGILPGGGSVVASLTSYAVEKRCSKYPEEFGQGHICGVAGPESANNAASSASFIPLLTLGIPANASIAMIFAALMIQGITPGPFLVKEHADVFWGVIASMYIGNAMLLVLNLPLVGLWVQLLRVPFGILAPIIVMFTSVGVYSIANDTFSIYSLLFFGLLGYLFRKLDFEPGPLPMAFVLEPIIENSLRQSLLMSQGSMTIFLTRPISAILLAIFFVLVAAQVLKKLRSVKRTNGVALS
ncbi:tripartite tricarboxylate transporter permease [Moorella sp. ACPs]|uniref:tripartite tricarboxylate transporter permease n=1 Tax=Neomoorella carbonis TaxID=3062783 RepID=UPI00324473D4